MFFTQRKFFESTFVDNEGLLLLYWSMERLASVGIPPKRLLVFYDDGEKGKSALAVLRANVWRVALGCGWHGSDA